MKKLLPSILLLLPLLFVSCDKVPMNGDLDGLWQLMTIENADDTLNLKAERRYCSFQLHLFMLGDNENARKYFGYFEHKDKQLRFYSFTYRSQYTEEDNYDQLMTDDEDLHVIAPWGFYSTDCTFDVLRLNSSELILQHEGVRIFYRKI